MSDKRDDDFDHKTNRPNKRGAATRNRRVRDAKRHKVSQRGQMTTTTAATTSAAAAAADAPTTYEAPVEPNSPDSAVYPSDDVAPPLFASDISSIIVQYLLFCDYSDEGRLRLVGGDSPLCGASIERWRKNALSHSTLRCGVIPFSDYLSFDETATVSPDALCASGDPHFSPDDFVIFKSVTGETLWKFAHCEAGPSTFWCTETKVFMMWRLFGRLHRLDGPAIIETTTGIATRGAVPPYTRPLMINGTIAMKTWAIHGTLYADEEEWKKARDALAIANAN